MKLDGLLKSKRFWAAAAVVAVIVLKDKTPLSDDQIQLMVWTVGSWIVGESVRPVDPPKAGA
jgi:hypothetical protein